MRFGCSTARPRTPATARPGARCGAGLLALLLAAGPARAAEPAELELAIEGHRFVPPELRAPAGVPLRITVRNRDDAAEEVESAELKVEKVVAAGRSAVVRLQPLAPGRYPFFGEFHPETAQGVLIVEAR